MKFNRDILSFELLENAGYKRYDGSIQVHQPTTKRVRITVSDADKIKSVERLVVNPTVYGVGRSDTAFYPSIGGVHLWQYSVWKNMLQRCFSVRYKETHPAYKDATCCDEWLSFANFFEWINKEVDYGGKRDNFDLDKDILVKGNKVYSPETCSLIPRQVNTLLNSQPRCRGEHPVGVSFAKHMGKFCAKLSCSGKRKHLGFHNTSEDAFAVYKQGC